MSFSQWLEIILTPTPAFEAKLIASVAVVLLLSLIRLLIHSIINRRFDGVRRRYTLRKGTNYTLAIIGLLFLGRVWLPDIQQLATYLGLLSAGLAIALTGPLSNLAGWAYILWRRPFEIGDRIEIDNVAGDVIDISIFQFTVLEIGNWVHADQSTGRIAHLPNRQVFDHPLANYTKGFDYIWHELEVTITFESDWEKAKAVLSDIATRDAASLSTGAAEHIRRAAQRFAITYSKLTPIVYLRVVEYGVMLTIRYLCDPRRRRSTEQAIWEDILREFAAEPDIEFAYPTQRFYQRHHEPFPKSAQTKGETK
jgi:small-conductance mechanosensitive channel